MSALAAELTAIDLGDRRLDRRAGQLLQTLGEKPTLSIPGACNGWDETRAAYRLFDQDVVTAEAVLAPCLSPAPRSACASTRGSCVSRTPPSWTTPRRRASPVSVR